MSSNQKPFMNKNETSNADYLQRRVMPLVWLLVGNLIATTGMSLWEHELDKTALAIGWGIAMSILITWIAAKWPNDGR